MKKNIENIIMFIVSLILLLCTVNSAVFNTLHYDEAFTYLHYGSKIDGFAYNSLANNHPLNSLLIYFSTYFFPFSDFMIRFPNIIFLLFYLYYSIKISNKTKLQLLTFSLLTMYWYLIPDFFSQARGYGISCSLILIFIYQLVYKNKSDKNILSITTILLLANYAFIGLVPLIFSIIFIITTLYYKEALIIIKKYKFLFCFFMLFFTYILILLYSVSRDGKPLYGAFDISFFDATIGFYLNSFFYGNFDYGQSAIMNPELVLNPKFEIFTVLIFLFIAIKIIIYNKKFNLIRIFSITVFTFFLYYLSSTLMTKPFITGRSLLPLYPLFIISLVEFIDILISKIDSLNNNLFYRRILGFVLFVCFVVNYQNKIKLINYSTLNENKKMNIEKIVNGKESPQKSYYIKKSNLLK